MRVVRLIGEPDSQLVPWEVTVMDDAAPEPPLNGPSNPAEQALYGSFAYVAVGHEQVAALCGRGRTWPNTPMTITFDWPYYSLSHSITSSGGIGPLGTVEVSTVTGDERGLPNYPSATIDGLPVPGHLWYVEDELTIDPVQAIDLEYSVRLWVNSGQPVMWHGVLYFPVELTISSVWSSSDFGVALMSTVFEGDWNPSYEFPEEYRLTTALITSRLHWTARPGFELQNAVALPRLRYFQWGAGEEPDYPTITVTSEVSATPSRYWQFADEDGDAVFHETTGTQLREIPMWM